MQDNWSDAQLHAILAEVCFAQDKLEKYINSSQNKVITNPKLEPTETNIEGKNFNPYTKVTGCLFVSVCICVSVCLCVCTEGIR